VLALTVFLVYRRGSTKRDIAELMTQARTTALRGNVGDVKKAIGMAEEALAKDTSSPDPSGFPPAQCPGPWPLPQRPGPGAAGPPHPGRRSSAPPAQGKCKVQRTMVRAQAAGLRPANRQVVSCCATTGAAG